MCSRYAMTRCSAWSPKWKIREGKVTACGLNTVCWWTTAGPIRRDAGVAIYFYCQGCTLNQSNCWVGQRQMLHTTANYAVSLFSSPPLMSVCIWNSFSCLGRELFMSKSVHLEWLVLFFSSLLHSPDAALLGLPVRLSSHLKEPKQQK